jgi:glutamine cyclotransferase
VREGARDVVYLNEIEWMKGEILANVWQTDRIARINPLDGRVIGWIDLGHLRPADPGVDVLNGIAYDQATGRLYVTGKWWPKMHEIRLVPKSGTMKK